eukprot:CAMPEP_0198217722 /NCGR_PEP_ID=MMETSP1445-20131203/65461_1 /TAXON_ID=36898 /ORGANISM="Pyramimonas sp., Strain CCMP2087" /LENGTH=109 /DNA_ID=CAMNT_0043894511 /DNA_START=57 /DNA_END=386 /DNA_ORIENTATION=+
MSLIGLWERTLWSWWEMVITQVGSHCPVKSFLRVTSTPLVGHSVLPLRLKLLTSWISVTSGFSRARNSCTSKVTVTANPSASHGTTTYVDHTSSSIHFQQSRHRRAIVG